MERIEVADTLLGAVESVVQHIVIVDTPLVAAEAGAYSLAFRAQAVVHSSLEGIPLWEDSIGTPEWLVGPDLEGHDMKTGSSTSVERVVSIQPPHFEFPQQWIESTVPFRKTQ